MKSEAINEEVTISLPEEFGIVEIDAFRKETQSYIDSGVNSFIINFNKCKYIDSTGLGLLISLYKKVTEVKGQLLLKDIHHPSVSKIFRLTRLDKVFKII